MRHVKMLLIHQDKIKSMYTQIGEVRKLPPQVKFLKNEIRESFYYKKIHKNHFYEISALLSESFSIF